MLSTELPTILIALVALSAAVLAIFSWKQCRRAAEYAAAAVGYVETTNKKSVTLAKLAEIEASLTDLTDSYAALMASHKKLRARIGMRAAREKNSDQADLSTAGLSDGQKSEIKKQLRVTHILKGK